MARQKFGGSHTEQKLAALQAYLKAYTTALSKRFKLAYFDAFAGTGEIELTQGSVPLIDGAEVRTFIPGSARLALECEPKFHQYLLVEKSPEKARDLQKLKDDHAAIADRIQIISGEANAELQAFCRNRDWDEWRAIVFLDPYGNQVNWETIAAIAATPAIDLWYLFPSGLGVHRQIGRDGSIHYTHGDSIDALLGTTEWRDTFVQTQSEPDLFSGERQRTKKTATPESITNFMINRMRGVFRGVVLDEWLPLGARNVTMYSLIFASANPSPKAKELSSKLAKAVLRSKKSGRTKRH